MNRRGVNRIIRYLIISDFFLFFAVGLLAPIFAVFVLQNIENRIEVIGYAVACYWGTRVVMVIPFSRLMDRIKGESDEYFMMVVGTFMIALIPLFYAVSSKPWHIYLLHVANGFANSLAVPAWRIIFTNHIDKRIVGFEWSLEDVGIGIATASSAALGAVIADKFGFNVLFVLISVFGLISASILLALGVGKWNVVERLMRNKPDRAPVKLYTFK